MFPMDVGSPLFVVKKADFSGCGEVYTPNFGIESFCCLDIYLSHFFLWISVIYNYTFTKFKLLFTNLKAFFFCLVVIVVDPDIV